MNKYDEAIGYFKYGIDFDIFKEPVATYAKSALEALQQAKMREVGCEYCKEARPILSEIGDLQIDDEDKTLWLICQSEVDDIYEEHTQINYCLMCGRELTEENKNDN